MKRCQGTMSALPRPSAKGTRQEILLVDGGHYLGSATLERPVADTRNTQGAFLLLAGLRDIDTPDRRRAISLTVHGLKHGFNPSPEALFRLRYLLAIHPRRRVLRNLLQILPHSFPCDVMRQRSKPELWLTPSFRCYPFESCCHGWRFFSLHRRPNPPVVWSPCCPRTVQLPLAASPCGRLSRPRSTTSQSDFRQVVGSSSPCRLVGPYKLRLNLTDLPCSHGNLRQHAGGTNPGSITGHSPLRILGLRLPL